VKSDISNFHLNLSKHNQNFVEIGHKFQAFDVKIRVRFTVVRDIRSSFTVLSSSKIRLLVQPKRCKHHANVP